ncbi:hypothetical protein IX39_13605 [Chryseobacterium formosense]|uniref:YD repeat-containing protein n=1 Tax=Chryseobacterium formosense TaxID=236814 RepID=A0A085Z205_9FLAO|nr:hypothetical protein [Chryseobacterium formosense]KFE98468.1 hypothetical protein IX39_13605 [Chryseobacterium formosense]SFT54097.1 hypothetical protein SAMN05421857_1418 [Chryseobacterium formosense]
MKIEIKKVLISGLLALIGVFSNLFAQQQISYGDFSNPVPSVSSIAKYQETPVALATGLPNITLPIVSISSTDKNISENLTLSYNPNTASEGEFINQVGLGWTLFSGGVISRLIVSGLDERFDNSQTGNYTQNTFDDIYYYSLPNGLNGKFTINRNNNSFVIYDTGVNNVKIDYTRTDNNSTLIVDSFIVTDDKGYKFIFSDYSQNLYSENNKLYRSAFFLSSIKSPSGVELLKYEYQKDNRYYENTNVLFYQSCKLKKIDSPGNGSINITYFLDHSLEQTLNDPYSISSISLKTITGKTITKYDFLYELSDFLNSHISKRTLKQLKKVDPIVQSNVLEITSFVYNTMPLPDNIPPASGAFSCYYHQDYYTIYPKERIVGVLKKIIMPTGGVTEYNFEPNEFFYDKSSDNYTQALKEYIDPYIQHVEQRDVFTYNTNQANTVIWNIPGDPTKKKRFYYIFTAEPYRQIQPLPGGGLDTDPGDGSTPNPSQPNLIANFTINNGDINLVRCGVTESPYEYNTQGYVDIYPGNYTIQFISSGTIKGNFITSELITESPPFLNIGYGDGLRIGSIKTYVSSTNSTPTKTVTYQYNNFDVSTNPSGTKIQNESYVDDFGTSEYIVYKNITVTDSSTDGFVRHYLKTPADYPNTQYTVAGEIFDLKHYYNITKGGLESKTEIYNNSNQIVHSTDYEYDLLDQSGTTPIKSSIGYVRPGIIKRKIVYDRIHNSSQVLTNKVDQEFNNSRGNYKLLKVTATSSDGQMNEKTLFYPTGLVLQGQTNEYQHLWDSNMKGLVIKTTEKRNGTEISSLETKFANNSLYPTSIISKNSYDNSTISHIRNDNYDNQGNLIQFTVVIDDASGEGVPTTIIYGYNKTLPIAKIEGAKLSDIPSNLITAIVNASNEDANATSAQEESKEQALIAALNTFKNDPALRNFMVTCYTYNPLVGITTTIPPNGLMEFYKYDSFNRLLKVVDVNGNTVKEHLYNYKN